MLPEGKVALVTGGSRGIGKGIAEALSSSGASVAISYNKNRYMVEETVNNLRLKGKKAIVLQMSIEDRENVRRAFQEINSLLGSVDILVNNAAISQEKPFETITDDEWEHMLNVNLKGPFICSQEALKEMLKKRWGRIINISSVGGQWGGFNQVHYAASKAGLINLTQSLARIYSRQGVNTNAIAPGLVQTDMAARELNSVAGQKKVDQIPVGRVATIDEIAWTVVFLVSDMANYITGQTINVNGGMYFG